MSNYPIEQRAIQARLLTQAGWITGTLHVPHLSSVLNFINNGGPFLKLTEVALPDGTRPEFFALRRASVSLIVPAVEESELRLNKPAGEHERHQLCCLMEGGSLDGSLSVLKNVRVSDYLLHHSGFCVMRECKTHDGNQIVPLVLVNTDNVVGVTEPATH